jgi:hypothetical protein
MKIHDHEQYSQAWWDSRLGLPTASDFKKIITSTGAVSKQYTDYARVLAADIIAGKSIDKFEGNAHTERGTQLEHEARLYYQFQTDSVVQQTGFITDDMGQYGCSPDGLIGESGTLEIKCQSAKGHIASIEYYLKHTKMPTDYVAQTQGALFVTNYAWNDLLFYHPDLPSLMIRSTADIAFQAALKQQILATIAERNLVVKMLTDFNQQALTQTQVA